MKTKKIKICIVIGTRPEIIKMGPVIKECQQKDLDFFVIHTGQHYSYNMDKIFMEELNLPDPKYNLAVGSSSHGNQTAKMIEGIEKILIEEQPYVVLVQGDTNSVLAGAIAASKLGIKVGHIEAGLRSYDRNMPEEINRIITDNIADYLFAPTDMTKDILIKENISKKKIFNVGNTIVDAVNYNIKNCKFESELFKKLNLLSKEYILITSHRAENVDNEKKLEDLILGINKVQNISNLKAVWPMHPRTLANIKKFNLENKLKSILNLFVIEPVGYFDSLNLQKNAKIILTDSGGIQEEACVLNVPCITLRDNTERPESLMTGGNLLTGTNSKKILSAYKQLILINKKWKNPFGDGKSAVKIIKILEKEFNKNNI